MPKRKPTAKQLAAREKFKKMIERKKARRNKKGKK